MFKILIKEYSFALASHPVQSCLQTPLQLPGAIPGLPCISSAPHWQAPSTAWRKSSSPSESQGFPELPRFCVLPRFHREVFHPAGQSQSLCIRTAEQAALTVHGDSFPPASSKAFQPDRKVLKRINPSRAQPTPTAGKSSNIFIPSLDFPLCRAATEHQCAAWAPCPSWCSCGSRCDCWHRNYSCLRQTS